MLNHHGYPRYSGIKAHKWTETPIINKWYTAFSVYPTNFTMRKHVLKPWADPLTFNLHARNYQVILTGEKYRQKQGGLNGIESVETNGPSSLTDDQTGS